MDIWTRLNRQLDWRIYLCFLNKHGFSWKKVKHWDIVCFLESRVRERYKPQTVANTLSSIRGIYRDLGAVNIICTTRRSVNI